MPGFTQHLMIPQLPNKITLCLTELGRYHAPVATIVLAVIRRIYTCRRY